MGAWPRRVTVVNEVHVGGCALVARKNRVPTACTSSARIVRVDVASLRVAILVGEC